MLSTTAQNEQQNFDRPRHNCRDDEVHIMNLWMRKKEPEMWVLPVTVIANPNISAKNGVHYLRNNVVKTTFHFTEQGIILIT